MMRLMNKRILMFDVRPKPKKRPMWVKGRAVTPKDTRDYEELIGYLAMAQMKGKPKFGNELPIKLTVVFSFEVPNSWSKDKKEQALAGKIYPVGANIPDTDNLLKSLLDGLNGVVYVDDKTIVEISARKTYSDKSGIIAVLQELEDNQ